jgi:hypothetical protein
MSGARPDALRALSAAATGPLVVRRQLRARTRALRATSRAVRHVTQVGARLPDDVIGGRLIDVFSARLQALLAQGTAAAAVRLPTPGRTSDQTRVEPRRDRPLGPPLAAPRARAAWPDGRPPALSPEIPAGPQATSFDARLPLQAGARSATTPPDWPESGTAVPGASSPATFDARAGRAAPPGSMPPLVRALRRYWTTDREAIHRSDTNTGSPEPSRERQSPAPPPAVAGAASGGLRPDQIAARMAAFARRPFGAADARRAHSTSSLAGPAAENGGGGGRHGQDMTYSRPDAAADFGEKLADALRDQAILHGVDLS